MTKTRRHLADLTINPYIAMTDLLINLSLIFIFFASAVLFMGRLGRDDVKYRSAQAELATKIEAAFPVDDKPWNDTGRNDPPGAQRWVFESIGWFEGNTDVLSAAGRSRLAAFAGVLDQSRDKWRRVRIEGHSQMTRQGRLEDWRLSAGRAARVARYLSEEGHIAPNFLSVSSRGGQNPLYREGSRVRENERIEIILEFANKSASGESLPSTY